MPPAASSNLDQDGSASPPAPATSGPNRSERLVDGIDVLLARGAELTGRVERFRNHHRIPTGVGAAVLRGPRVAPPERHVFDTLLREYARLDETVRLRLEAAGRPERIPARSRAVASRLRI